MMNLYLVWRVLLEKDFSSLGGEPAPGSPVQTGPLGLQGGEDVQRGRAGQAQRQLHSLHSIQ